MAPEAEDVLGSLGGIGRYQLMQISLLTFSSFVNAFPTLAVVFIGYQPDYQCQHVNASDVRPHLDDADFDAEMLSVEYSQCSIDVIVVNDSVSNTSYSLPCLQGVNFSMPSDLSLLTEWSLVCDKKGLTELSQTLIMVGMALGALLFSSLADRYGRKPVYVGSALGLLMTTSLTSVLPNYPLFIAFRLLTGALQQGIGISAYTMFMEILPREWRSVCSVVDGAMWAIGSASMALIAFCLQTVSWRTLNLVFSAFFLYSLALPWLLDESLRWLIATGNLSEAERILRKACKMNKINFVDIQVVLYATQPVIKEEKPDSVSDMNTTTNSSDANEDLEASDMIFNSSTIDQLLATDSDHKDDLAVQEKGDSAAVDKEMSENTEVKGVSTETDLGFRSEEKEENSIAGLELKDRRKDTPKTQTSGGTPSQEGAVYSWLDLFRYRVVLVPLFVCTFVWTCNSLYYYGVMLGSVTMSGNRFLNFAILSLLDIPAIILDFFLLPRVNRKPLSMTFQAVASLTLLLSVGLIELDGSDNAQTAARVLGFMGKFALTGSYCALFVYCLEVFPTSMRTAGMGFASAVSRLSGMLAPFVVLLGESTPWVPGVLMGGLCLMATLTLCLLPETRHTVLPDKIDTIKSWGKRL